MMSANNNPCSNESSNNVLFEDSQFPMGDSDDEIIGELSQSYIEATQFFQTLRSDQETGFDFEKRPRSNESNADITIDSSQKDKFVLFEDESFPMKDSDDILGELSQDFMECSEVFQKLPLYLQVGSGFENRAGPSRVRTVAENISNDSRDIETAVQIEVRSTRWNKKYNANQITMRARVDPDLLPQHVRNTPLYAMVDAVRVLFAELIRRTTEGLRGTDLIRFCIQAEGLDKPISTNLVPVSEFTVEKVISDIMKVLQSKDEIGLDAGFMVDAITIQRDVGAGRDRRVINVEIDRLRKKSILSIPYDNEGLCCAKAILYALAHLNEDKTAIKSLQDRRRPTLLNRARELHRSARVPLGPCTYAEVAKFEEYLNVQIVVISTENLNKVAYKDKNRGKRITLWLHNGHFEVIKSLTGFYASNFYCESCEKAYDHLEHHNCSDCCRICFRRNCMHGEPQRCIDCDRLCKSRECFNSHKTKNGKEKSSICDRMYQCRECCRIIQRKDCAKEMHICGTSKCPSCSKYFVAEEHFCYLRTVAPKISSEKVIFFDFETDQSLGEHVVNFALAQYTDGSEKIFRGYNALHEFCSWLFSPKHKDYTIIAHNMKGFDGQFLMAWLLEQGTTPDVIPNGSKLMTICHSGLGIRIIDSINFLPMALSKLPPCFGLNELKKGYFPHLFNVRSNQTYIGSLPDLMYYNPDMMMASSREDFLSWYEEHRQDEFNFQEEMLNYCRSDVDILRRCCMQFRSQFIEITDVDPFCYVTIASACMAVYRSKHIQENTIAMVPVKGYNNRTNYSQDCIRWLDYVAASEGIRINHALNGRGERKLFGISVDGFCEETNTIYQYHGCFYHGCSVCFDEDVVNPVNATSMGILRRKTEQTTQQLSSRGYNVIEMWEHDFKEMKNTDDELKLFISTHHTEDRLNPRDAFFGGRTNAVKLYYEGNAKYVDFTSLYPWVNKYCKYPLGHPIIITEKFESTDKYFGLIKCCVLPPRGLYLPVLPYRCQNKLMFPLCRTCVENTQQDVCEHTDSERCLTGTWVSEELKKALEKGYSIIKMFEVYHFEESSDGLFRSYIDLFLKIKQESSGWPKDCRTSEDKEEYIKQYEEKEGVLLNADKVSKNPGRRQVAKLALNSFWGRWGMNLNKTQLRYVNSVPDFNKMFLDPTKKIKDVYLPNDHVAALQFETVKDFIPQDISTNVFLAAFTTAWARLKLYSEMEKLDRSVIYHDTDSIIYEYNERNDVPLGKFLGEFTDELEGDVITTFVSGGPKNYAYVTTGGKMCCKVRGFTLNFNNEKILNFDSVKTLVCSMDLATSIPVYNPAKICREPKRRKVVNKPETKKYKLVYDKRVIVYGDYSTLPYGY